MSGFLDGECLAQDSSSAASAFNLTGTVSLTGDISMFSCSPANALPPRRVPNQWRLIIQPTLSFGDWLQLPLSLMLTTRPVARAPSGSGNIVDLVRNPRENLEYLSISPRFGWCRVFIGTHMPHFSELSSGEGQMFGAGVSLRPGIFRFSTSAGTIQRAILPDSSRGIRGAYARWISMSKLGIGSESGTYVDLNFIRAKDDAASLPNAPVGVLPQEGMLGSLNFQTHIGQQLTILGEGGVSVFTRDMTAEIIETQNPTTRPIYCQRISTFRDAAAMIAAQYTMPLWNVKVLGRYLGPGYITLGFPFAQNDRLEFLATPRASLFDRRVNVSMSLGTRVNNLSGTKTAASRQFIANANVFTILTEEFSLNASYGNYGIRNDIVMDTLRIRNVSQSISVSPTYVITSSQMTHSMSLTYALDDYEDYNVVSGALNSYATHGMSGSYGVAFRNLPMSLTAMLTLIRNTLQGAAYHCTSGALSATMRLLEGVLNFTASLMISSNRTEGYTSDTQQVMQAGVQWTMLQNVMWSMTVMRNAYQYGTSHRDVRFVETVFQTSVSARL